MNTDNFRVALKAEICRRGDSQAAVSRLTGVPQPAISRLLSGKELGTGYTLALLAYLNSDAPLSQNEGQKGTICEQ